MSRPYSSEHCVPCPCKAIMDHGSDSGRRLLWSLGSLGRLGRDSDSYDGQVSRKSPRRVSHSPDMPPIS